MKELIASIIKLFPAANEYNILCSKDIYNTLLSNLNTELGNTGGEILIKSFQMQGKTFNIREGLSVEKGFKIEF